MGLSSLNLHNFLTPQRIHLPLLSKCLVCCLLDLHWSFKTELATHLCSWCIHFIRLFFRSICEKAEMQLHWPELCLQQWESLLWVWHQWSHQKGAFYLGYYYNRDVLLLHSLPPSMAHQNSASCKKMSASFYPSLTKHLQILAACWNCLLGNHLCILFGKLRYHYKSGRNDGLRSRLILGQFALIFWKLPLQWVKFLSLSKGCFYLPSTVSKNCISKIFNFMVSFVVLLLHWLSSKSLSLILSTLALVNLQSYSSNYGITSWNQEIESVISVGI